MQEGLNLNLRLHGKSRGEFGLIQEFMTATNVTSLFGATQLIVATPVAANLLQTTEGDLFMRIYIDMSYPDPGSMRHGRLYTVVDTGVYDQNLHLFAHHFIHPFQMQFEEGDRNFFAVHDCHFPVRQHIDTPKNKTNHL